jgi:uncharacterized protein (DUF488 family)
VNEELPELGDVFTVGHSNHPPDTFLRLLRQHRIELVVDVRSNPHSGYASHFNKESLGQFLAAAGIEYLFLGDAAGGRPDGDEFYDAGGRVLYDRVAASNRFQEGIERLIRGIGASRLAILCGEEDPTGCHRRLLVGRVLRERGARLIHIRGDGKLQSEESLAKEEAFQKTKGQMTLFDVEDPDEWKSTRSASRKEAQASFSRLSGGRESGG